MQAWNYLPTSTMVLHFVVVIIRPSVPHRRRWRWQCLWRLDLQVVSGAFKPAFQHTHTHTHTHPTDPSREGTHSRSRCARCDPGLLRWWRRGSCQCRQSRRHEWARCTPSSSRYGYYDPPLSRCVCRLKMSDASSEAIEVSSYIQCSVIDVEFSTKT